MYIYMSQTKISAEILQWTRVVAKRSYQTYHIAAVVVKVEEKLQIWICVVLEKLDSTLDLAHSRDERIQLQSPLLKELMLQRFADKRSKCITSVLHEINPCELRT